MHFKWGLLQRFGYKTFLQNINKKKKNKLHYWIRCSHLTLVLASWRYRKFVLVHVEFPLKATYSGSWQHPRQVLTRACLTLTPMGAPKTATQPLQLSWERIKIVWLRLQGLFFFLSFFSANLGEKMFTRCRVYKMMISEKELITEFDSEFVCSTS